jgi:DNA-binding transcriptional regulator YhcF (GntR family)
MWFMAVFAVIFLILLGWLWWAKQESARASALQLEELISEARMVSQDMEAMLSNAVDLSRSVIDDFDRRLQAAQSLPSRLAAEQAAGPDPVVQFYQELAAEAHLEMQSGSGELKAAVEQCQPAGAASGPYAEEDYEAYRHMHPTLAVHQLYRQGMDVKQISQILQRGQGEVHLILNLERKKKMDKAT